MKILSCLVSIALVAQPLLAQDAECFIEDSKGRKVDLGEICGKKKPPVALPSSPRPQFVSIPIKNRRGNTPVIEVTFNGDQTFDMILDTGATGTSSRLNLLLALKPRLLMALSFFSRSVLSNRSG
jgi:aspartyl protease family protein